MAFTEPTKIPRWSFLDDGSGSDNDVVNGTSGQNNVVEPTETKKNLGWDFEEFPPRNWFNWIHRITGQWLGWIQQEFTGSQKNTLATLTASGFSGTVTVKANFTRIGNMVICQMERTSGTSNSVSFTLSGIPADFVPNGGDVAYTTPTVGHDGGSNIGIYGAVVNSGIMTIFTYPAAASASFTNSGAKGIGPVLAGSDAIFTWMLGTPQTYV